MAKTALGGNPATTVGELPAVGEQAPDFTLVDADLQEFSLSDLSGRKVLSIFPSIGTGVCQAGVRKFNDLPAPARKYLETIEELVGSPVEIVSVGPDREQTIFRGR